MSKYLEVSNNQVILEITKKDIDVTSVIKFLHGIKFKSYSFERMGAIQNA